MATVEIENRFGSITSAFEFVSEHPDVENATVVPARHIVNLCVSPVEQIESADQGNNFMHQFIPTDHELNGNAEGLSIDYFEEQNGLLRLGRITVRNVDCFMNFSGPPPAPITEGDFIGLKNVFSQTRSMSALREEIDKPLMVRFYPSQGHLEEMLETGENTTVVPLQQIAARRRQSADERISKIDSAILEAKAK